MNRQTCEQIRPRHRELQSDRPAERVSDDVRGGGLLSGNQQSKVRGILFNAALARGPLALAVPAPVVRQRPERAGKTGHDGIPVVVIAPRTVDEHNRRTLAVPFRIETNAVDDTDRHRRGPTGRQVQSANR